MSHASLHIASFKEDSSPLYTLKEFSSTSSWTTSSQCEKMCALSVRHSARTQVAQIIGERQEMTGRWVYCLEGTRGARDYLIVNQVIPNIHQVLIKPQKFKKL